MQPNGPNAAWRTSPWAPREGYWTVRGPGDGGGGDSLCKLDSFVRPFSLGPDEMEILLHFIYGAIVDLPPGANSR